MRKLATTVLLLVTAAVTACAFTPALAGIPDGAIRAAAILCDTPEQAERIVAMHAEDRERTLDQLEATLDVELGTKNACAVVDVLFVPGKVVRTLDSPDGPLEVVEVVVVAGFMGPLMIQVEPPAVQYTIRFAGPPPAVENAAQFHAGTSVVISDDPGGQVDTFVMWYARLRESGVPVILRGLCESACTFILTLPPSQVCVEPTALLGFHLATVDGRQEAGVTEALIKRYYPPAVQEWLRGKKLRAVPIYMDAETMVRLGVFPACQPALVA